MGHFKNKAKEWDCLSDRTNIVFFKIGLLLLIVKCTVTMSINIAVLMAK